MNLFVELDFLKKVVDFYPSARSNKYVWTAYFFSTRKIAPWKIAPWKIAPDPKPKPAPNSNQGGHTLEGSFPGGNFPVTGSISICRENVLFSINFTNIYQRDYLKLIVILYD